MSKRKADRAVTLIVEYDFEEPFARGTVKHKVEYIHGTINQYGDHIFESIGRFPSALRTVLWWEAQAAATPGVSNAKARMDMGRKDGTKVARGHDTGGSRRDSAGDSSGDGEPR